MIYLNVRLKFNSNAISISEFNSRERPMANHSRFYRRRRRRRYQNRRKKVQSNQHVASTQVKPVWVKKCAPKARLSGSNTLAQKSRKHRTYSTQSHTQEFHEASHTVNIRGPRLERSFSMDISWILLNFVQYFQLKINRFFNQISIDFQLKINIIFIE